MTMPLFILRYQGAGAMPRRTDLGRMRDLPGTQSVVSRWTAVVDGVAEALAAVAAALPDWSCSMARIVEDVRKMKNQTSGFTHWHEELSH